ncbi:hypothetical protein WQO_01150 [Streptomyces globisporus C-1027]|uniref:WD40 repeat domain-containing protein n=1 Tax=Streptomyces globisporus C-1027 TaxID=1172567 RepID=A0A0U3L8A6_STRGL|nr:hypothetical protein [Streptomyces globisporus]ALU92088.1 hypothetical protein WQO_01150 [Streptomyces globisporus C-1027]
MSVRARLRATVPAPLPLAQAGPPEITGLPGYRLLVQRSDDAIVAQPLADAFAARAGAIARFPAPWPRRRGTWEVAPDAMWAVFAGVHAVRAVDPSGATRWEVRHGCWSGGCEEIHASYESYADRRDHRYPESGSVGFSADGRLVWAHVRGPLPGGELSPDTADEWLVIDAGDGRVLARADAEAAAAGSAHLPHPTDPAQMGLSIGEGQDGARLRWGRWDGKELTVDCLDGDLCLLSLSPSGDRLMTVSHDQDSLAVRDSRGAVVEALDWDADAAIPRHPEASADEDELPVCWDWAGGFLDETTLIASTTESDEDCGQYRHWLVDTTAAHGFVPVDYPSPVSCEPTALGGGLWSTLSPSRDVVHVWSPDGPEG